MKGKMTKTFFFDTYALIELGKNNPGYRSYKEGVKIVLTELNLLELTYFLLREGKRNEIDEIFEKLSRFSVPYDKDILVSAAEMKFKYKTEKLSFVDCIGYELARRHGCKFLTGDEKFRNKKNVEFVK